MRRLRGVEAAAEQRSTGRGDLAALRGAEACDALRHARLLLLQHVHQHAQADVGQLLPALESRRIEHEPAACTRACERLHRVKQASWRTHLQAALAGSTAAQ